MCTLVSLVQDPLTMQRTRSADAVFEQARKKNRVDHLIRHRIRDCPYAYMFSRVDWTYDRGTLRLDGAVQSFYLKQVLQELVRDIDHVEQIVNQVNVVSPRGLSSVRPR